MPKISRRRMSALLGTSCLAAALAFPHGVTSAAAVPVGPGRAATQPAQPTPPPPPETPEPQTPEPDTPAPQTPETQTPETQTPETQTPETPGTQTSKPQQNIVPQQQKKKDEARERIDGLNAPKKVKDKLKQAVDKASQGINDPKTTPGDKKIYEQVLDEINKTLVLIQDPKTSPRERRALTNGLQGVDEVLKVALDEKASSADRTFYRQLAASLTTTALRIRDEKIPADQRNIDLISLEIVTAGLLAVKNPDTKPKKPTDQKKIEKKVKGNAQALVTSQNPKASDEERAEAQKKLDQLADSVKNSKYKEFLDQVKQYNASSECLSTIENRTRSAGWPDGSLWGLSDPACDQPRAAGVQDTSNKWNKLFVCVDENAFSTCAAYIPKD
ncbi:hypothetical protein GCM10010304_59560 [Streptomyces roseoviolaceus]